jgi:hypothetical protein
MNTANLIQAARGPVLLITLGVLLVIDHFGGAGFWRMSPLLLIVYGVMKLLERVARPPAYVAPYGGPQRPQTGRPS